MRMMMGDEFEKIFVSRTEFKSFMSRCFDTELTTQFRYSFRKLRIFCSEDTFLF